jgi:hypothetical protein
VTRVFFFGYNSYADFVDYKNALKKYLDAHPDTKRSFTIILTGLGALLAVVWLYIYISYTCVCVCARARARLCMYLRMYVYVYIHILYTYIYICIYAYMHIYMSTHTRTQLARTMKPYTTRLYMCIYIHIYHMYKEWKHVIALTKAVLALAWYICMYATHS